MPLAETGSWETGSLGLHPGLTHGWQEFKCLVRGPLLYAAH